jgi:RNase adaptor protein for sRNA GlmZ degradation
MFIFSGNGSLTDRYVSNQAISMIVAYLEAGSAVASVQTTCHAGTHRSVAAAEIIAQEMRKRGVDVVVRHLHRRRGLRDPW